MTFRASFLYALRIIFPGKRNSSASTPGKNSLLGAVLCIGISLVPLIAVITICDGMIQGITGRMVGLYSQDICVRISPSSRTIKSYDDFKDLCDFVDEMYEAVEIYPEVQTQVLVAGGEARMGATVRAMSREVFSGSSDFAKMFTVSEGSMDFSDEKSALIGSKISSELNLHAGDKIKIISMNRAGDKMVPKVSTFTVSGIVSCGYQELDALWVFIPIESGFRNLSIQSSTYIVGIKTEDTFSPELPYLKNRISKRLASFRDEGIERCYVYTWNQINSAQYENFSSTKILLLLIMLLIVLVASVNISSALVMIVMERRKEIAILKSTGGTAEGIGTSFLMVGFACGLGGILIGFPLGLLASVNINHIVTFIEKLINFFVKFFYILSGSGEKFTGIHLLDPAYYLQSIPISLPLKELLVIALGTLLLSLVVSAVPAIKAGKEKPLDTLRKM